LYKQAGDLLEYDFGTFVGAYFAVGMVWRGAASLKERGIYGLSLASWLSLGATSSSTVTWPSSSSLLNNAPSDFEFGAVDSEILCVLLEKLHV
jgi:hypothetical protein